MLTRVVQDKKPRRWPLALVGIGAVAAALFLFAIAASAANPAADIDQCRNGAVANPQTFTQCAGAQWQNGNAGKENSHYQEGESISYRARVTNLTAGDNVVLILGYDVIHGGNVAIDYLTDKNGWQTPETSAATTPDIPATPNTPVTAAIPAPPGSRHADPTKTIAGGCIGTPTTGTGPLQPITSYNNQAAGREVMEFFGVSGTPVISYVGPNPNFGATNGDQEQQIQLTFTSTGTDVTIAWGGHIASRLEWGCTDQQLSAGGINGSPYHMRLKDMTVNGKDVNLGNQDRSLSAQAVVVPPDVTLTKTPSVQNICNGSNTNVTYTYVVHNAGGVDISGTVVDDNGTPANTADDVTVGTYTNLSAGQDATFTHVFALSATRTNIASTTATTADNLTDTATATATVTGQDCNIEVTKSPSQADVCSSANTSITYTYHVTNPGTVALTNVTVSDDKVSGAQAAFQAANGGSTTLAVGADISFTLSKVITTTTANTVTASGNALGLTPADTDTATATVTAHDCNIEVTKSPSTTDVCSSANTSVTYTYHVTNPGNVALTGVAVSDDKIAGAQAAFEAANGGSTTLAVGADISFTLSATITTTTTNTVTASGNAFGLTPADTDTASATVTAHTCSIDVTKSANPTDVCSNANTLVTFTYHVINTGNVAITGVAVSDDKIAGAQAAFEAANSNSTTLAAGADVQFTLTATVTSTTTNTVSVSGTANGLTVSDTASSTVTAHACDIEVTKSPSTTDVCSNANTSVTYTYHVKNMGDVPLTGVTVSDDKVAGAQTAFETANSNSTTLAVGADVTFTLSKVITTTTMNTVTVAGNALGNTPADTDTASALVTAHSCDIEVTKSPSQNDVCSSANTSITYTYHVINAGDVALTGVLVDDDKVAGAQAAFEAANGNSDTLAVGADVTFTLSKVVTTTTTNTVTASGNALGNTPADTDTASATVTAHDCDIEVTKSPSTTDVCTSANTSVTYTYHVINAGDVALTGVLVGDVALTGVLVDDDKVAGAQAAFEAANGNSDTLAAGADISFTLSKVITATTSNTVTASGNAFGLTPADSDTASATVTAHTCSIDVTKSPSQTDVCSSANTSITYTYHVINTGDVPITGVTVDDDKVAGAQAAFELANGNNDTLAPAADISFTLSQVITTTTTNTVTAAGTANGLAVSDTATATVDAHNCDIQVTKSPSQTDVCSSANTSITYTYHVINAGDVALTGVSVSDDKVAGAQAAFETANGGSTTLAVGADIEFTLSKVITTTTTNTVTATGNAFGLTPADTDTATATVTAHDCNIEVTKSASQADVCSSANTSITYTYHVINAGNVDLTNVSVSDDNIVGAQAAFEAANGGSTTLAAGADITFTLSKVVTATTTNTVSVSGNAFGLSPADSDTATAVVTAHTCSIEVTKSPSKTNVCSGANELVTYTYHVINTGNAALTNVTVSDDKISGAQAAFEAANGGSTTLAVGANVQFTLSATINATTTNTVTASGTAFGLTVSDTDNATVTAAPCGQGCTPGFWQGGFGINLWNQVNDPDWTAHGGAGTNPFVTTTKFGTNFGGFFPPSGVNSVDSATMLDIVGSGGGSNPARKAARDLVAAYLNASFGINYPQTTAQILADWNTAVAGGSAGFKAFHDKYGPFNALGCSIS